MREPTIMVEERLREERRRIAEAKRQGKPFWTAYRPAKLASLLKGILQEDDLSISEKRVIWKSCLPQIKEMSQKDRDDLQVICNQLKEDQKWQTALERNER